jgi:serine/threonine protein kinase
VHGLSPHKPSPHKRLAAARGSGTDLSSCDGIVVVPVAVSDIAPVPSGLDLPLASLQRVVKGRYRILRPLARGGMSTVYLAREVGLDRQVAIKVLNGAAARHLEDRERFRREARTLAGLAHPSIVPVLALGEPGTTPYFVMRYVPGESLADRLERVGRLGAAETCAILADVAEALDFAHRTGVIHRDVKPENILLEGGSGRALLTDFGVAIVLTSEHSRSEVSKSFGTPDYMSPEQILGEQEFDGRGDLYSLGVVGFRMLAGRLPFRGSSPEAVAAQHVSLPAPAVEGLVAGLPPRLASAINRCLEKEPRRRWPDGRSLAGALRAAVGPAPLRNARRLAHLVRRIGLM